jgi:putative spermidine/putrescine transport system permease protein
MIPLVYVALLAFYARFQYPMWLPSHFTLNYLEGIFLKNSLFYESLKMTIITGGLNALFSTLIGMLTARALVRHLKWNRKLLLLALSLPLFIPSMPLFLGVHQMLLKTPFINHISGVVLGHMLMSVPYATIIFVNYFSGIPEDIELVAKTLGSNNWRVTYRVIVPMVSPGIALSLMISFLISNTEYFSTFLLGGGNIITLSMIMFPYISNNDYGYASVSGMVFVFLHVLAFMISDWFTKDRNKVRVLYDQC